VKAPKGKAAKKDDKDRKGKKEKGKNLVLDDVIMKFPDAVSK